MSPLNRLYCLSFISNFFCMLYIDSIVCHSRVACIDTCALTKAYVASVLNNLPFQFLHQRCDCDVKPKISYKRSAIKILKSYYERSIYMHLHVRTCFVICPLAIAYSMGQIIKSVCVCLSVRLCVSVCPCVTLTVAFLCRFSPNWTVGTEV